MRSKKDLNVIEATLLERKKKLEEELIYLHNEKIDDGQVQDPGDQALSALLENLKSSLQDNELNEYRMIVVALEQIKKGAYGTCTDCQQEIPEKRLESYPNAARCVVCQEIIEDSSLGSNKMNFL